jgi:hypothetical protein
MLPIQHTCHPRQDILQGSFNPEVFTASLSQEVRNHLEDLARTVLAMRQLKERLENHGITPAMYGSKTLTRPWRSASTPWSPVSARRTTASGSPQRPANWSTGRSRRLEAKAGRPSSSASAKP